MSAIGVDIGGTKSLAVRLTESAEAARSMVEHDPATAPLEQILESIASVDADDATAIGIGIAGLVNPGDGALVWGPHLPGTNMRIRDAVEARFSRPTVVDNDANMALFGELRMGVAVGYSDVLLVTLGTGIGGAIAIDGEIFRGGAFAGEWGHMQVERNGDLCDCGKRGCWETLASGPALVRLAREVVSANPESSLARVLGARSATEQITAESVVAAADSGDETARSLVAEVGRALGQGLADLVAIFDPELVIVGGGLGSVGESILGPARRVIADSLHGGSLRVPPPVLVAGLGPAAGAIGAAIMATEANHGG
ncbi:MAG: ROK family protein [Acidimicrobiia bacterium]